MLTLRQSVNCTLGHTRWPLGLDFQTYPPTSIHVIVIATSSNEQVAQVETMRDPRVFERNTFVN